LRGRADDPRIENQSGEAGIQLFADFVHNSGLAIFGPTCRIWCNILMFRLKWNKSVLLLPENVLRIGNSDTTGI
jgi:hypothetical protein